MKVSDVTDYIEKKVPREAALSWDNTGLLVGGKSCPVHRIYLALDATSEVISHAAAAKADLLITHHPMIFSEQKSAVEEDYIGKRVLALVRAGISLYAMHTNYDIYFMADDAAGRLGLFNTAPIDCCVPEDPSQGIGRIGTLPEPMTLSDLAGEVKRVFGICETRFFGDPSRLIKTVGILPGSGKTDIDTALLLGADVLITGDIDHHSGLDAVEKGISVIDAGHYGIEHIFLETAAAYLRGMKDAPEILTEPFAEPFSICR